jgi:phenylalanyl-tRNA synthetase beta subunit
MQTISEASPILEDVDLIDEYWEESFLNNQSLTFRLIFQSEERTLTEEEVNAQIEHIKNILKRKFRAEIR